MIKYFNSTRFRRPLFVTACIAFLAICALSCSKTDEIPLIPPTNEVTNDQPCLTFYRNTSRNFTTYLMSDTRGTKIFDVNVGNQGWSHMTAVTVGKRQFIVGHNGKAISGTEEKDFSIRLVTNRGRPAEETQTGSWERNYENLMGFHVDDKGFIFGQDSYGDHKWFTQEVLSNGTLAPAEADFGTWDRYYETATPIYVDGKTYLIFHCSGSVNWFIARVWSSGKISVVSSGTWGRFWEDLTAVQVGGNTYLIGMTKGPASPHSPSHTKILFVQRVNADGTLGEETEGIDEIGEVPDLSNITGYECSDRAYVFGYYEGKTNPYIIREVTQDGHIQDVSSGTFDTDFQFVFPLHVYDPGNFRYMIGIDMSQTTGAPSFWSDAVILPWSGETKMGGGAALAQIDGDAAGKLDAVMVGIQRTVGPSYFYYKVAYNLTTLGEVSSWSPTCWGPVIGNNQEGAGADIADIDGNGIPDLLLMCVDAPSGSNSFRYYIGWNLSGTGQVTSWSPMIQGPTIGYDNSGGGAALGDIDGNGRPEVVFMGIDNTATDNYYWYTIGLNLDVTGKATAWTDVMTVNCDLGWSSAGGGAALADVNNNGKLDLILMNVDSPSGANPFWYHVGWDIDINGNRPFASNWSSFTANHLSNITNGGGLAVGRIDNNDNLDILLMSVDDPYGND
jgi:hypothetical protein